MARTRFSDQDDDETMTVSELINELARLNPSLLVYTEGCDCIGRVRRIEDNGDEDGSILLCREE